MSLNQDKSLLISLVQSGDTAAFEKLLIEIHRPLSSKQETVTN